MLAGPDAAPGRAYTVIFPWVVMLATWLAAFSVNHMVPSGPSVIPCGVGFRLELGTVNLDSKAPEVFMTPMALEPCSVNQMSLPGPAAMVSAEVMEDPTP